ncbi:MULTISPECIES: hypothetical protein [unclassified Pseudoxanthomonas]|uniref:hypothetical protein n=1 Tax=unclassified Pseudoxanthomonas TaxID=2645906 RepID=UPI00161257A2|nr:MULTISPECIES: hypothetical protein [unclassified Pseudoxanthomonas]MBB3274276.1 hypothetical protein [Pseudoxanthomonas sp. OG2]MBV7474785.1 hypothetical protein [Pseudoxanthomonas sp. PXM05]
MSFQAKKVAMKLSVLVTFWGCILGILLTSCARDSLPGEKENDIAVEVWTAGRGYTQVLELSKDGTYRAFVECDVCDSSKVNEGRWEEKAGVLTVLHWQNDSSKVLRRGMYKGCVALLPVSEDEKGSLASIFFRIDDACPDAL